MEQLVLVENTSVDPMIISTTSWLLDKQTKENMDCMTR